MTVSTHTYQAFLIGTPDVELQIDADGAGDITLDAGRAPHVEATLALKPQSRAVLDALDPRLSPRGRVDVVSVFPTYTASRSFDLGVRGRPVAQADGTVALSLASDEAMLEDARALADDHGSWSLQASLRSIVARVLDLVIPGAVLVAGVDADVTSYWDLQNQLSNPSAEGTVTPWTAGGNCTLFASGPWTDAPAGVSAIGFTSVAAGLLAVSPNVIGNGPATTPGKTYTFSGYGRRNLTPTRNMYAVMRWLDAGGIPVAPDVEGVPVALGTTGWVRCSITAICPPRATRAEVFFRVSGSTAASQIGYVDCAMFNEGPLLPYFDGATVDTATYLYSWAGNANASASSRKALVDAPTPDAFVWRAGDTALDFLHPLVQAAGLRLVCDETRAWTLRAENYTAPGALNVRYGVNLIDGEDTIDRGSELWFDAAVTRYTWLDSTGTQQQAFDTFAMPGSTKVRLFEKTTAYPGPGFSEYAVRRAQGRGREVTVTTVADWRTHAEQPITVVLNGAPTQTGKTQQVTFNLANDRMTATTRTTDTSPSAWVLIPVGETWLDSPVGESWIEEVI